MPESKSGTPSERRETGGPRRSGRRGGPGAHFGHPPEKPKDVRGTLRRLLRYLLHYRWQLVLVVILVALATGLGALGPYLMGRAIDDYILRSDLPGLMRLLGLMILMYLLASVVNWLQSFVMVGVSQRTVRDLRDELFSHLQLLSLRFFDGRTHGELMSRLSNDVDLVNQTLSNTVTQLTSSGLSILMVATMMLLINWHLALVTMTLIPLMVTLLRVVAKRTRQGFRRQQEHLATLNGIIEETVTGIRVVKAYVREEAEIERFAGTNRRLRRAGVSAQVFSGAVGPMMNMVNNIGLATVAGVGGWMALNGMATVGTIASFINYARRFTWPLNQLAQLYNQIQSSLAGAERVFEIMDEVPEIQEAPDAVPLPDTKGEVVFDDVCFSYEPGVPALKHVSLHAEPGQTIALVGPTGAGKTTIVNLLTRFYDIDSGRITIDGIDIRRIKIADLRKQLGIVLQDTFLFSTTVMENIRYGRLDATDEEVIAAAKLANADEFIRHLPEGYQTVLSENGSNLSQGQRQLLAISRAVLADPGILVLDEATSSVDTRTERHIQEAMLRLMEGRTSFVIAHRLSTVRQADCILVIDHGEIVERGTHEELMQARGFYYDLFMSQFRGLPLRVEDLVMGGA